jgi:hypothetical protein
MSDLSLFFAGNAMASEPEAYAVSDRFRDKDGAPVLWQLRPITEEMNEQIRTSSTKRVPGKKGVMVPETNVSEYMAKLVTACIVFPNLNDADLQSSYGVRGADALIRKMLLSGEYAALLERIQQLNGFDKNVNELSDEVKN